jgi:hypothetical protein
LQLLYDEICLLIGAVTGSPRVSYVVVDRDTNTVEVVASSLGKPRSYDISFELKVFSSHRHSILLPNFRKFPDFLKHPIFQIIPNLHSFAAYLLEEDSQRSEMLIAWNPAPEFFKNDHLISVVERIVEVCKGLKEKSTIHEVQYPDLMEEGATVRAFEEVAQVTNAEPLSKFLFETLIVKKRLLARNGVSFLALRQWRKPIKEYQIKALQALKSAENFESVETIADEIAANVSTVFGKLFSCVVPIPGGSSGKEKSLSVQIATKVAERLNIPMHDVLVATPVALGKSHPKKSVALQPYGLKSDISGYVLIVDDVASSGRHIELATLALRAICDYCTAVVWIAE